MKKLIFLTAVTLCISPLLQSQVLTEAELNGQLTYPTLSFEQIVRAGDSIYPSDTILSYEHKAYLRWKYFNEGRTSFPNATVKSKVSDLKTYLSNAGIGSYCGNGPASAQWSLVGPDPVPGMKQAIGLINCVAADPNNHNIVYAGTIESGLWKSTNGGSSWTNIIENSSVGTVASLGFTEISIDPSNSNNILLGTVTHAFRGAIHSSSAGFGVIRSTDAGATWSAATASGNTDPYWHIHSVKYHPTNSNIAIAAGNRKIYKSTDGGQTWVKVFENTAQGNSLFIDVEFSINSPSTVMASTKAYGELGPQVFVSTSTGDNNTWSDVTPANFVPLQGNVTTGNISIDVTPADPGYMYIAGRAHPATGIYKSNDGGQNWTTVASGLNMENFGFWRHDFEISDNSTQVMYLAGNRLITSLNGGSSFSNRNGAYHYLPDNYTHADVRDIHNLGYINGEDHLLIGNDGGVSKTTTSATSFTNLNGTGLAISQFYGADTYRSNNWVTGSAIHNAHSTKRDGQWALFLSPQGDGDYVEINHFSEGEDQAFYMTQGSITKTSNKGLSISGVGQPYYSNELNQEIYSHPCDPDVIYAGYLDLYSYRISTNTWTKIFDQNAGADQKARITAFAVAPSNPDVMYLAYNKDTYGTNPVRYKFYRTLNGGQSWFDISADITFHQGAGPIYHWSSISDIVIDPEDERRVFVSLKSYATDAIDPTKGVYRVYARDYQDNWTDMSNGLTPVPVNDLEYLRGTDDMLLAGTDAGVYYYDKANSTWQCFNNGLPNTIVTRLEYNPCSQELYAATLGRGIHMVPMKDFFRPQHHVHDLTIWDCERFVDGDIIVHPNAEFTISTKIQMGNDARIIIKPHGKVTLANGGVLTSGNCNENWSGIWMEGQSGQPQTASYQPKLILQPGSIIEYAEQAITSSAPPSGNDWIVWGTQGGIIEAEGALFRNNTRDVSLVSYTSPTNEAYKASFKNCDFIRTTDYRNPSLMAHVSMMSIEGVIFEGCQFDFDISNNAQMKENGEGIYALNATFTCNSSISRTASFTGYRDGARAYNVLCALTARPIEITNTVFTNNRHSIYLSEAQYAKVSHNTLNVPNAVGFTHINDPLVFQPKRYGIYMDGCQDFELYENNLSTDGQNSSIESVGMIIKNSGPVATEVYGNSIDGFTVGIEAIGRNHQDGTTDVGLTFKCNDIGATHGNDYDVFVAEAASHPENGIQIFQGSNTSQTQPGDLPNNLFTPSGKPFTSNFQNEENSSIVYYYGQGDARLDPKQVVALTDFGLTVPITFSNDCPERPMAPPESVSGPNQDYTQAEADLSNHLTLRTQYIDEGATPQLEAQILFASSQEEYQDLYIDLMEMAPYVSEDNLLNVANISDYPELALRNIMVANPHAARSPDIMEALYEKEPPLSQQTIDDIEAGEQTITSKDVLDMQVMDAQARSEAATLQIVGYYRAQEELENIESHLLSRDEPHFHYAAVDARFAQGDVAEGENILDDIPTNCVMGSQEQIDYAHMVEYYNIVKEINLGDPEGLSSQDAATLSTIASYEGDGPASGRARNALALFGQATDYYEPLYIPGGQGKKATDPLPNRPKLPYSGFSVSPNPTNDYVVLSWNWFEAGLGGDEELRITLYDLKGSLVIDEKEGAQDNTHVVSTENLPNGVYIMHVTQGENVLFIEKIIKE